MILICDHCGFNNPPGMRFCGNCGTRLKESGEGQNLSQAPKGIETSQIGIMMGADLMTRFQQAGLEAAGQKRHVTVLFADLCDYTCLAEQIQSEDLFNLIQNLIRSLVEIVYKYEGTVDKILGDGLMALFGAPIAHENNAERAARAALDMQMEINELNRKLKGGLDFDLKLHIGIHSGQVVVGSIGSNMLMDYTAIGDTVNLANRLEEIAEAGMILVSESVYRNTKPLFDYHPIAPIELKGFQKQVPCYYLLGLKSEPGSLRGLEGFNAPLVGRESELKLIKAAVEDLILLRRGHLILVSGEAGIGKSRLTAEVKSKIQKKSVQVFEGHSLTYRRAVSYWIFIDFLRSYLSVTDKTPTGEVRERLVTKVYNALGSQATEVLPYFEYLLSLEHVDVRSTERLANLEAGQLRQQIFLSVRDLLLAEARRHPVILILEDLHWADDASLDLLLFLVDSIDQAPLLLYGITRPYQDGVLQKVATQAQALLGDRFIPVHLQGLSPYQSERLLSELLSIPDLHEGLRSEILQKAAGIPFYLEEILRMLIDEQIIRKEDSHWRVASEKETLKLGVPDNLQGLILARFDRLAPDQKKLLQAASVIGRQFNVTLLSTMLDVDSNAEFEKDLKTVVERAFISPQPTLLDGDYLFQHVLTSDAVYSTLLRGDRTYLHGKAGEAIEQMYAGQIETQIEVLAGHYLRSTYLDRALNYLILAGQRSARAYAHEQARRHFEQSLQLFQEIAPSPEQIFQVRRGLGDVLVFIGEYEAAREHYQFGLDLMSVAGSDQFVTERSILQRKTGITFERQGNFERALIHLVDASQTLDHCHVAIPVEKAQIFNDIGWIHFLRGTFDESRKYLTKALNLAEGTRKYDVIASIHNRLGAVAYHLREYEKASAHVRKSLALRETIGDMAGVARLYNNLGLLGLIRGDLRDAELNFMRSIELLERIGDAEGIALAFTNLGLVQYDRGDYKASQMNLEKSLHSAENIGHKFYRGRALMYLGRLKTALEDFGDAKKMLNESIRILEELGAQDNLIDAAYYAGENCIAQGDLSGALQWISRAQEAIAGISDDQMAISVQRGRLLRLQAAIARMQGDVGGAEKLLSESAKIFSVSYEQLESAKTAYERGLLAQVKGEPNEAREFFKAARVVYDLLGAEKYLEKTEQILEQMI